jgi:hypothetical protein
MTEDVQLSLSADEALVLFDWLHRMEDQDGLHGTVEDNGELVALWNLSALLERELVEPLQADYRVQVAAARRRLATSRSS